MSVSDVRPVPPMSADAAPEMGLLLWISEAEALPRIAQHVLFAVPRQMGEFWDISVARLLARHEAVLPIPIKRGDRWASDYYWNRDHFGRDSCLVTGNGWWASMVDLPLPPGAEHEHIRGFDCITQPKDIWIGQRK